ncbi:hypothetical protein V1477_007884 [Vespula maculifrons]|uniref:Uncharacterized protein n=1 Tax=Vespula maculifrons TaxID=7453 RepID=A0ABD2CG02_VESMC
MGLIDRIIIMENNQKLLKENLLRFFHGKVIKEYKDGVTTLIYAIRKSMWFITVIVLYKVRSCLMECGQNDDCHLIKLLSGNGVLLVYRDCRCHRLIKMRKNVRHKVVSSGLEPAFKARTYEVIIWQIKVHLPYLELNSEATSNERKKKKRKKERKKEKEK